VALTVLVAPAITQQPLSRTTIADTNVSFSVTATGSGVVSYQWKFNGSDIAGAVNATLVLNNVQPASAGSYTVAVSNSAGSTTSAEALLTVLVAPGITQQPQSQSVIAGTNVTLAVTAAGSGSLSYQWKLNGNDIANATNRTLVLANIQPANAGNYTVLVGNAAGSTTSGTAALVVLVAPAITQQPQAQTANAGTNVTFSVVASGSVALGYQWRFGGTDISGATTATLILTNVQPANAGNYSVVVTNAAGSVTSAAAALTVLVAPTITQQPQSQTVTLGANASFSVTASGSGVLAYQWRFNGSDIPGANTATLTLNNIQPASAGIYTAVVSNSAGSVTSAGATVTVQAGLAITQQPQAQIASVGGSATFSVTATGAGPLSYQWLFNGAAVSGATSSTLTLNNVQSANAGNYSVQVSNAAGSVVSSPAALSIGQLASAAQVIGGVFQFRVTVPAGRTAVVQTSTDLVTWTNLTPTPISGNVDVTDNQSSTFVLRFYRVVLQ
jgi:hypothetical protein